MELPQTSRSPGQIAYEAYADALGWSADGHRMRTWDDLNSIPHLRVAWETAGEAVIAAHMAQSGAVESEVEHSDGTPA